MNCEHAYTKDGVRGYLCARAEEPKSGDLKGIAHALCGQQRFCPNMRCYQMLPGWEKCPKRAQTPEETPASEEAPKKKSAKRRAKSAE